MNKTFRLMVFFAFTLCFVASAGCNAQTHISQSRETPNQRAVKTSAAISHNEEKLGIMTSADYLHWEQVSNKVSAQRRMSDDDLDWAVSMMQKPSTQPADVHEKMMGYFLTMRTFGPMQQQKIRAAVTPLLSSHDPLELKYVQAVIKKMG